MTQAPPSFLPHPTTPPSAPERTKRRLLELVKRDGPLTARAIANRLQVSLPAARRHLVDLQSQNMIECQVERPAGRGRPQHVYHLTERGEAAFPKTYADLCVEILSHLEALFGTEAVERVLERRNQALYEQMHGALDACHTPQERAETLCKQLSEMGFDPVLETTEEGLYLLQRNCPNLSVARAYRQLCEAELQLYRKLWEPPLERLTTITCGQAGCRYRLS